METPQVRAEAAVDAGAIAQAMQTPGVSVASAGGTLTVKAIYMEDVLDKVKEDNEFHASMFPGEDALKDASAAGILKDFGFLSKYDSFPGDNTLRHVSNGGPESPFRRGDIVFDVQEPSPSPPVRQVLTHAQAARQQEKLICVQDSDAAMRNAVYGAAQTVQAMVASLKNDTYADPFQVLAQNHAWSVAQGRSDGRFNSRSGLLVGKRDRRLFEDAHDENVANKAAAVSAESRTANDFDKFMEDYKYMHRTVMGVIKRFQAAWGEDPNL